MLGSALGALGVAQAQSKDDTSLTMHGITLYGIVDIGLQYDTNGAPISDYFVNGGTGLLQKNSRESITGLTPSNLTQSRIGLRGAEPIGGDWNAVFRVETCFNPQSGDICDALKSLALNNGKAATAQTTGVDSSITGELFNMAAYAGLSSKTYGTVTFGRQNGLQADGIAKYDPQGASNAFSVIGYSGAAAGGGDTEDRRLDDSLKYDILANGFHFGAQYQFNGGNGADASGGKALEAVVGFAFPGGSIDAYYVKKDDAVGAAAMSAAQAKGAGALGFGVTNSLAATISDNKAYSLMGQYTFGAAKVSAGYEHITFSNPSTPLPAGANTIGGYTLAYVNNTAFPKDKTLQIGWVGLKYSFSPTFDLTGAYYGYKQNSYGTGANAGCSDKRAGTCSGTLAAASIVALWHYSKRFDVYAGAMWSSVSDGLANGYLQTSNVDPTIGVRFTF